MSILETISFGEHFFTIAMVLRETMFVNGILTNAEIWYDLKPSEVKSLEDLDLSLLRKIFSTPVSCPKEALYLESGVISIGTLIKCRRIKYFHYLMNLNENSMLSKFFHAQLKFEAKNDWTVQVRRDFDDFSLSMESNYLKTKSKESFKVIVKTRALDYELNRLNNRKGTKTQNLRHTMLEMRTYLKSPDVTPKVAKMIFSYRTRMAKFSENFRGSNGPLLCPLCQTHLDNQPLAFTCPQMKNLLDDDGKYEYLFNEHIPEKTIKNLVIIENCRDTVL